MGLRLALALIVAVALVTTAAGAHAQELEPKAYSNSPIGLQFVILGTAFSQGGLSVDPSLPVEDAKLRILSAVFAYARVLDLWGLSGKVDVIVPIAQLSGTGTVDGQPAERQVSGFGDARLRLSINLYGAPALSAKRFGAYKKDLVIGTSVQVSPPSGQYDPDRLINLGTHRWSIKPDVGLSKVLGPFTVDVTASATFFADNDDFFGGRTLSESPVYGAQANVTYDFGGDIWASLGTTYYRGGRLAVDGDASSVELGNARIGAILAVPLSRNASFKLNYSRGVYTRAGTDFSIFGFAWQYRWGAGF